jgi:hypothetical protein
MFTKDPFINCIEILGSVGYNKLVQELLIMSPYQENEKFKK